MVDKKLDPFGINDNQAQNYDLERPRYPKSFIEKILLKTTSNENFLDVGTGTGILFFELAGNFSGTLAANDISAK